MNLAGIRSELEAAADEATARSLGRDIRPLRGLRGVPNGAVARIATAAWQAEPTRLPRDHDDLSALFSTAWEDGLVAIGLLAATIPDSPEAALDLGLDFAGRTDDVLTADALGWLVLGPAALASGRDLVDAVAPVRALGPGAARRAAVMAGMAATATPIEGPAAGPVRARLGVPAVQWVDTLRADTVARVASTSLKDEAPQVRKAMRRLLRAWAQQDPVGLVTWSKAQKGGLPAMLRDEVDGAKKQLARMAP